MPKKNMCYACIACITIGHPQVYLEECKYKIKKIQMFRFIYTELKSDLDLDLELDSEKESKFDAELMAK